MNPLAQTFGVEIEFYLPAGLTRAQAAPVIAARIGEHCAEVTLNHRVSAGWKLTTDGSLGNYIRGTEAVSPVLSGEAGFARIEKLLGALEDLNCSVNVQCGLHVHVGHGPDPRIEFFRNLAKLYAAYEPVIDAFMPRSRRANNSIWCQGLTHMVPARIDSADRNGLIAMMAHGGRGDRYVKLNYATHLRGHPTVEFRQHSGTLNYAKTRMWIMLCLRMAARAQAGDATRSASVTTTQLNRARPGTKAYIVGQMLLRPEGVDRDEACAATGWPAISLPQQAAACGLTVTAVRTGRRVRYYARAAVAAAALSMPAAPTLETFFDDLGCDAGEREFYRRRTAELSGSA